MQQEWFEGFASAPCLQVTVPLDKVLPHLLPKKGALGPTRVLCSAGPAARGEAAAATKGIVVAASQACAHHAPGAFRPCAERPKADSLRFESNREAPAPSAKHSPPPRKKRRPAGEAPLRGPALAEHMKALEAVVGLPGRRGSVVYEWFGVGLKLQSLPAAL